MFIKAGDKFRCIEDVVMDTKEVAYIKGRVYESENDNCITDEQRDSGHSWLLNSSYDRPEDYFEKIEDTINYIKSRGLVDSEPIDLITKTTESLCSLLLYKNSRYGSTGLKPLNILLKDTEPITGLLARAEDKIARMQNSPELRKNDVADLIGYLTLICVSKGWTNFDEFKD